MRPPQSLRSPGNTSLFRKRKAVADATAFLCAGAHPRVMLKRSKLTCRLRLLREVDLGCFAVCRVALEVLVPVVESGKVGPDAVGELAHIHVVVFERLVVALAFDGDPVFGSGQLVRQAGELLVALQVGILLLQTEERPQGDVQLGVGRDVARTVGSAGDGRTRVGDVGQDRRLFAT